MIRKMYMWIVCSQYKTTTYIKYMTGCNVPFTEWWIVYSSVTHTFRTKAKAKMFIWLFQCLILSSFFLVPGTSSNFYNKTYSNYSLLCISKLEAYASQVLNATKISKKNSITQKERTKITAKLITYLISGSINWHSWIIFRKLHVWFLAQKLATAGYPVSSFSWFSSHSPENI